MPVDFSEILVNGVSSRALFNLEEANEVFQSEGIEAFRKFELENEDLAVELGAAFYLVKSLLQLNSIANTQIVEVVVMSRNSPETRMFVLNSIKKLELHSSLKALNHIARN
jgi:5'-nucleotidase